MGSILLLLITSFTYLLFLIFWEYFKELVDECDELIHNLCLQMRCCFESLNMSFQYDLPPPCFSRILLYPPSYNLCQLADPLHKDKYTCRYLIQSQIYLPNTIVACSCHPVEVTLIDRSRFTRYGPFPIKRPSMLEHPGPPLSQIIYMSLL